MTRTSRQSTAAFALLLAGLALAACGSDTKTTVTERTVTTVPQPAASSTTTTTTKQVTP